MPSQSNEQDNCSQCNQVAPLLACDDLDAPRDKNGAKPRFCNNCMIGKKVRVFWPVDESWYTGTVQQYDPIKGEHCLQYPDGDTEWVKIGEIIAASNANTASAHGSHPPPPSAASPSAIERDPRDQPTLDDQANWAAGPSYLSYNPSAYPPPPPPNSVYPPMPYGMRPPPSATPYHAIPPGYPPHNMFGNFHNPYGLTHSATNNSPPDNNNRGSNSRKSGPKPWTKEEDALLLNLVHSMQWPMKWTLVAQSLPDRTGKQCRERYVNHLNPRLKNTDWTPVEDATIFHLYNTIGSHWAKMSKVIPGRTDNGIKNRFHNIRRQYEREDTHRVRLSVAHEHPDQVRLDRLRNFPSHLTGKSTELWEMKQAVGVLAAQSSTGEQSKTVPGRFGPFREVSGCVEGDADIDDDVCVRCGLLVPSVHTGNEICTKTGWCVACTRIPPNISGNLLRECLNLRRCQDPVLRNIIENSWEEFFVPNEENAWPYSTKNNHPQTDTNEITTGGCSTVETSQDDEGEENNETQDQSLHTETIMGETRTTKV